MMDFFRACEIIYKGIIRGGHPGIIAAGSTESVWVISPAPKQFGVMEYGLSPYFVDKSTGKIARFSPVEEADWLVLDTAVEMAVPEQFKPVYNKP